MLSNADDKREQASPARAHPDNITCPGLMYDIRIRAQVSLQPPTTAHSEPRCLYRLKAILWSLLALEVA